MAIKFQFNKVALQSLQKELKIRQSALPTLKSKEAYLRVTIKKQKQLLAQWQQQLDQRQEEIQENDRLWSEFPLDLLEVTSVALEEDNVAGIKVPAVGRISYETASFSGLLSPSWMLWGISTAKELGRLAAEIQVAEKRIALLEYARKKTTQKVNLYEKVQIPEFSLSILKIKRYLEDVENLEKAAQKITKNRQNEASEAA